MPAKILEASTGAIIEEVIAYPCGNKKYWVRAYSRYKGNKLHIEISVVAQNVNLPAPNEILKMI